MQTAIEKPKNSPENSFSGLEAQVDQTGFIDPNTVSRGRSNSLRERMVKQSKSLFHLKFLAQQQNEKETVFFSFFQILLQITFCSRAILGWLYWRTHLFWWGIDPGLE